MASEQLALRFEEGFITPVEAHRFGAGSKSMPKWSGRMRTRRHRKDIFIASRVLWPPASWYVTKSEPSGNSIAFP